MAFKTYNYLPPAVSAQIASGQLRRTTGGGFTPTAPQYVPLGGSGVGSGGSVGGVGADAVSSALQNQQKAVNNLSYKPIDLEKLKADAADQAAKNAAASLHLEQQTSPGVAQARTGLQNQVAAELALQGNLPPDIAAQVNRASAGRAGASGVLGSQAPATAAALGLTALDLANSRRANAAALLAANPLQPSGLDPGAVAGLSVADTNAQNQFNLSKLGAQANLANSQIAAAQGQRAFDAQQQALNAANNIPTTLSAMPYVPLGGGSGTYGAGSSAAPVYDYRGNLSGTVAPSVALYNSYAAADRAAAAKRAAAAAPQSSTLSALSDAGY